MGFDRVESEIDNAVQRRVFPGAVLLVRQGARVFYHRAFGYRSVDPEVSPMHEDTIFDVSSLTKPLATTGAVLLLVKEGKIRLDDRVTRLFHNFGVHGKTHVTFRHLLCHSSGLPAWKPYFRKILQTQKQQGRVNFLASPMAKTFVYQEIHRETPEYATGAKAVYSDLGFMLLGEAVEEVSRQALDRFCAERIFKPLGLRHTAFVDLSLLRRRGLEPVTEMIAPTERCPWRKKVLCGEVHDDNAWAMGGVAGHAGLFSSAKDIDLLMARFKDCYLSRHDMIPQKLMRECWQRDPSVPESTRGLGWDTPTPGASSSGTSFSPSSVGHLGFTGTSIWYDPERDLLVVLLTNRVHPDRNNELIREFRPYLHDLVSEAIQ
jgi:CubicO group peptidase (beta-lactamase class C family)